MPQLDIGTYAPQLIWLAIVFIALYLVMSWRVLPRIATVRRYDKFTRKAVSSVKSASL